MHSILRTQKILTFLDMFKTGGCRQQKHIQYAPPTKKQCDLLYGRIKKKKKKKKSRTATYTNISPKMVNPRDIAGDAKEEVKNNATSSGRCVLILKVFKFFLKNFILTVVLFNRTFWPVSYFTVVNVWVFCFMSCCAVAICSFFVLFSFFYAFLCYVDLLLFLFISLSVCFLKHFC